MKSILTTALLSLAILAIASPAAAKSQDRSPILDGMFDDQFPMSSMKASSAGEMVERVFEKSKAPESASISEEDSSDAQDAGEPAARSPRREPSVEPAPASRQSTPARTTASGPVRTVQSTAYCLTGTMASGRRVYTGAAAMNGVPLGARYAVLSGPASGRVFTIEDRIGWGSQFDIAYPGDCNSARQYGRRTIRIARL